MHRRISTGILLAVVWVAAVAAHKCVRAGDDFSQVILASRTVEKCEAIAAAIDARFGNEPGAGLTVRQVDVRDTQALRALIRQSGTGIVLNLASPYCNVSIHDACLAEGAHYIDTAVAEAEHVENAHEILREWQKDKTLIAAE